MDINQVHLQGRICEDYKYAKTETGSEFATFSLAVEGKFKGVASTTYIRIMVFNSTLVQYLHDVKAKQGNRCTIYGTIQSYKREIKGMEIVQNTIIVQDITIRKTKKVKVELANK